MANRIIKNTVANIVAKAWNFASLYIFVPIWISYIGVEGYGVIAFYTVLSSLLGFADVGITATITREFSRDDVGNDYKQNLLKTIESFYFIIAFLVFIGVLIFAPQIVTAFLKSDTIPFQTLVYDVRIMGAVASINLLFYMYNGGLYGLQKQVMSNGLLVTYSVLRSVIVIPVLMVSPQVSSFLYWQLASVIVMAVVVRSVLLRQIKVDDFKPSFNASILKNIWKFSVGMMLMSIIASLNTQVDKLITGNVLSLEDLAYYSLAGSYGMAVLFISQPIGVSFYPELTRLISIKDRESSDRLFLLFTYIVSVVSIGLGCILFFYVDDLLALWLHDSQTVAAVSTPARFLVIGYMFMSWQYGPYYLAMSNGHTKTNVRLGFVMLIFSIPAIYIIATKLGLIGVAIPFVIINVIASVYLGYSIVSRFMKDRVRDFWKYSLIPGFTSLIIIGSLYYVVSLFTTNSYIRLFVASLSFVLVLYILLLLLVYLEPSITSYGLVRKFSVLIPSKLRYNETK